MRVDMGEPVGVYISGGGEVRHKVYIGGACACMRVCIAVYAFTCVSFVYATSHTYVCEV